MHTTTSCWSAATYIFFCCCVRVGWEEGREGRGRCEGRRVGARARVTRNAWCVAFRRRHNDTNQALLPEREIKKILPFRPPSESVRSAEPTTTVLNDRQPGFLSVTREPRGLSTHPTPPRHRKHAAERNAKERQPPSVSRVAAPTRYLSESVIGLQEEAGKKMT